MNKSYVMQIFIGDRHTSYNWRSIKRSDGMIYRYATREEAERMLESLYRYTLTSDRARVIETDLEPNM